MAGSKSVTREQVEQARQVDLLSWLQQSEPENLRRVGGEYCLRDHDSLKISPGGKWNWHSRGFGGRTALDYLIKVRGMGFVAAVETLSGNRPASTRSASPRPEVKRQGFWLPQRAPSNYRVTAYLQSRGIGKELIDRCIKAGILYESTPYHNAVFVGKDRTGDPKFACARGTMGSFKRDVAGSDKRFGFLLPPVSQEGSAKLAVFESPIDALSHAELTGQDCYRLSLSGTSPLALQHFLSEAHARGYPDISHISLCLDNDAAGLTASAGIKHQLAKDARFAHIVITHDQPKQGKDYNEALLAHRRGVKTQERDRQHDDGPAL